MQAHSLDAPASIRSAVDDHLAAYLVRRRIPSNLEQAVRYALLGPGKRTRPTLAILSCQALGGSGADALSGACAVEMIHAFSLVHDDLPALDNDDMRRGRATTHVRFGEALALLAGDAMMSLAFEILQDCPDPARCVRELSEACTDMIAGQVLDTLGEQGGDNADPLTPIEQLHRIHRNKTGALIRAACRIGAISAGATDEAEALRSITEFSEAIGLMFQVVDDLLDVEQSAEHVGKATGKDHEAGKLTYPGLLGIEPTRAEIRQLEEAAFAALMPLGPEADPLRSMCRNLATRTR